MSDSRKPIGYDIVMQLLNKKVMNMDSCRHTNHVKLILNMHFTYFLFY